MIHRDAGLSALAIVARLHGKSLDPEQVRHELAIEGAARAEDLLRAARRNGFKAVLDALDLRCTRAPLPCIVELREGGFAVLAKVEGPRALVHRDGRPQTLELDALQAELSGRALFIATRAPSPMGLARFGFGWFIPAIAKYRKLIGEALVASLALQVFALLTPLFFQVIVDKVLVHKGLSTLTVIATGLLAAVIFESVLSALRTYVLAHTTSRIDVELGSRLFRHLVALPLAYFESRRVGDTVARVRELENIRQFLTGPALMSVIDLAFAGVFLAVMLYYSPLLTLVVIGALPVYVALMLAVMPVFRRRLNERFARGAENQAFLVEAVSNMQTVKAGATEPQAARRWDEQLAAYVAASFRVTSLGSVASEGISLVQKLVTVGILWLGALQVIDGAMTVGGLVAFNMLAGRLSQPVLRLAQLWQDLQQTGISVARLGDILNTPAETARSAPQLPAIQGAIELDDVHFRYRPEASAVLRGVSLQVRPGEIIGIVGRSGCGKSTLAKLVQRLYVPERGRVLVDGVDLALADPAWLRRQVGVVLQEGRLFARTIRENIALADPGAPMAAVMNAAKLAGAHDFILELPEGYDTVVGEQGATLSGGQRQRIAIARALITNPRILILDEATAALDYESERVIRENMRFIAKGRTVIVIAHRLTAVRDANRILVMDRGELVESGTHAELVSAGGRYARLHALQAA